MSIEIRLKRGTSSYLEQSNPVLAAGEPCLETDTLRIKYGDGATPWRNLPYSSVAQDASYQFSGTTTSTAPLTLSGDKQLAVAVDEFFHFEAIVSGQRLSKYTPAATWRISGSAYRKSNGAITFVGTPTVSGKGNTTAVGSATVLIDFSIPGLAVRVVSATSNTVNWTAAVSVTKWSAAPYADTPVSGCADPDATNYTPNTDIDDGSCVYSFPPASPSLIPVTVEGEITNLAVTSGSNNLYPDFNPSIEDYYVVTSGAYDTCVNYSVAVNTGSPTNGVARAGQVLQINNGTNFYYVRLLPADLSVGVVLFEPTEDYVPGYYLTGNIPHAAARYFAIYDHRGVPLWYMREAGTRHAMAVRLGADFNRVALLFHWATGIGNGVTQTVGRINAASFSHRNVDLIESAVIPANSSYWDGHETLELAAPPERKNNVVALVHYNGFHIQEQSPAGEIVWEWNSPDYFASQDGETFHVNSVDVHPETGNILVSARHTNSVLCIEYSTKNVLWAIDGTGALQDLAIPDTTGDTKWLTILNEPENRNGTTLQHDARWHPDISPTVAGGDVISVYDNGGNLARGVIYEINYAAGTATHRASINNDQNVGSPFMGSYTVLADGDQPDTYSHAVYHCEAPTSRLDEYRGTIDGEKTKVFSLEVDGVILYRIVKVLPTNFRLNNLRATCGVKTNGTWFTTTACPNESVGTTALLLNFNGSNNSTTFTDSSPASLSVTPIGSAKLSNVQNRFGGTSLDAQDGGVYIADPQDTIFSAGGDFTLEFWVYYLGTNDLYARLFQSEDFPASNGWAISIVPNSSPAEIQLEHYSAGSLVANSAVLPVNNWAHVALTRASGTLRLFLNGELVGTYSEAVTLRDGYMTLGSNSTGGEATSAFFDDLRLVKGQALYTASSFPPPTKQLSLIPPPPPPNVALLLNFNGSNNSTTFTNSATNDLTVTANGDAKISTAESMFGGASGYFDGSGDYLTPSSAAPFQAWGAENWTLEMWLYPTNVSGYRPIFLSNGRFNIHLYNTGGLYVNDATSGIGGIALPDNTLLANQWQHLAISRKGSNTSVYVNGTRVAVAAVPYGSGSGAVSIGGDSFANSFYAGYIDDLRFTKNTALYDGETITVPTSELTLFGPESSLLLHFDGANNSTTFTDSSTNNLTVTANGDAKISTAESTFGGASGYFDGFGGDRLSLALDFDWNADFTIEFWMRRMGVGVGQVDTLIAVGDIQSTVGGLHLTVNGAGVFDLNNAFTPAITGGEAPLNTWIHVAAVRSSGTNTLYVDGMVVGTSTQSFLVENDVVEIGGTGNYGFWYNGYIDELRIVDAAIYPDEFTPPNAPFTS